VKDTVKWEISLLVSVVMLLFLVSGVNAYYVAEYEPDYALWLLNGTVNSTNDSDFNQTINITAGITDDNDTTTYLVKAYTDELLAFDDFECGDFSCGWGWNSDWYYDGNVRVTTAGSPISGSYHLNLQAGNGWCDRDVNITNKRNIRISFYAKAESFESDEEAYFYIENPPNSDNYTKIITWCNDGIGCDAPDDGVARKFSISFDDYDITYGNSTEIAFESAMGGAGDDLYVDNISVFHDNYEDGYAVMVKFDNVTFNPDYNYFLKVRKTSTEYTKNITIYAYEDGNNISTSHFVTTPLIAGVGWRNINVTSLVAYENSTVGNYTKFRFYTDDPFEYSEVRLLITTNETTPPTFNSCSVDDYNITYGETTRFWCNVTDNIGVECVNGTIEGTEYTFTQLNDIWYYDWHCWKNNPSVDFTFAEASDFLHNYNSTTLNVSINCYVPRPELTIISPKSQTYTFSEVPLTVSATTPEGYIEEYWYNLNGAGNITFTPNTTILSRPGQNTLMVCAANNFSEVDCDTVSFTFRVGGSGASVTPPDIIVSKDRIYVPLAVGECKRTKISIASSHEGTYTILTDSDLIKKPVNGTKITLSDEPKQMEIKVCLDEWEESGTHKIIVRGARIAQAITVEVRTSEFYQKLPADFPKASKDWWIKGILLGVLILVLMLFFRVKGVRKWR